jgi:hypothetical protein
MGHKLHVHGTASALAHNHAQGTSHSPACLPAAGVCSALLGAAPAWSKEQKMPADDMPAGDVSTVKPTLRPAVMQQTAAAGTPPLVYVRGGGELLC